MAQMPYIAVLEAAKVEAEAAVADLSFAVRLIEPDATGREIDDRPVTVRHYRGRASRVEEFPCVALRFGGIDPEGGDVEDMDVEVWAFAVDFVIDTSIPGEEFDADVDDPDMGVLDQEEDPTGLGVPGKILAALIARLCGAENGEPNSIGGTCWQVRYDGSAPDDDEVDPDMVRLSERFTFKYRARRDDPTVLLPS